MGQGFHGIDCGLPRQELKPKKKRVHRLIACVPGRVGNGQWCAASQAGAGAALSEENMNKYSLYRVVDKRW
jgi:hypothetical protein